LELTIFSEDLKALVAYITYKESVGVSSTLKMRLFYALASKRFCRQQLRQMAVIPESMKQSRATYDSVGITVFVISSRFCMAITHTNRSVEGLHVEIGARGAVDYCVNIMLTPWWFLVDA
jgi:hypothetical protein